jgi:hypothetical protein
LARWTGASGMPASTSRKKGVGAASSSTSVRASGARMPTLSKGTPPGELV